MGTGSLLSCALWRRALRTMCVVLGECVWQFGARGSICFLQQGSAYGGCGVSVCACMHACVRVCGGGGGYGRGGEGWGVEVFQLKSL